VREILRASCVYCHGAGEETHGNLDDILDPAYLESEGHIDTANPDESRILVRMNDSENPMPPFDAPTESVIILGPIILHVAIGMACHTNEP